MQSTIKISVVILENISILLEKVWGILLFRNKQTECYNYKLGGGFPNPLFVNIIYLRMFHQLKIQKLSKYFTTKDVNQDMYIVGVRKKHNDKIASIEPLGKT